MAKLFDPMVMRSLTLRNRIGVSPMCMYSSDNGKASDFHITHLASRAAGGAALIIAEATAVEARGRISPFDAGIWEDSQIEPAAKVAHAVKHYGAVPGIQLAHAGRKASTDKPWGTPTPGATLLPDRGGWQVVGASPVAFSEKYPMPRELTLAEIAEIQNQFVAAAKRSLEAGYELAEVHGAHGYLLHSFYSPLSNKRQDKYGGTFDNRIRFLMETVEKVRAVWPEKLPLWVRLSCTDWTDGGWTLEDSIALSKRLKQAGADAIDCSSGGNVASAKIPVGPGYQVPFAQAIRNAAEIPTAAVGMITDPQQAENILQEGQADFVLLAREMLRDPYWAWTAGRALKDKRAAVPEQYLRAGS